MFDNKIFLLGGSGFLGSKIIETKPKNIQLYISNRNRSSKIKIDLTNYCSVKKELEKIKPKIVIHTVRIDPYDNDPVKAKEITIQLTKIINAFDIKLIYISKEKDIPNPITDYGRAKLAAENAIKNNCKNLLLFERQAYMVKVMVYGIKEQLLYWMKLILKK